MELQNITTENKLANITTDFIKELYHVNYLVAYPISDVMLEGWAKCITELAPKMTISDIRNIINKMKTGEIEYDSKKGIQNIFIAYKIIKNNKSPDYESFRNG